MAKPDRDSQPCVAVQAHDHGACIQGALGHAEAICRERGVRLTPVRRRVLELVWTSHRPTGAYDLLRRLGAEHAGAAPPTVYRALDFLRELGLIHRIESLNAFVGCVDPKTSHSGQFLICQVCGVAAELDDPSIDRAVAQRAAGLGFQVAHTTIELSGLCPKCQTSGQP